MRKDTKTPEQIEIAELKKQVKAMAKQMSQMMKAMTLMEKKLNRTYHAQASTANQLNTVSNEVQRMQKRR